MKNIIKNFIILIVLFLGLSLFFLSHTIGGWRMFIVKSGSMEPTIATGSLIFTDDTQQTTLQKDDIITFVSPSREPSFITHRITKIKNSTGEIDITTKGDNNKLEDEWKITQKDVVGKVRLTLPYLGYAMAFVQSKLGILLFILIPSIYIIVEEIHVLSNLLSKKEKQKYLKTTMVLMVSLMGVVLFSSQPTYALLSDSTIISNNTFSGLAITPSNTPTPSQACEEEREQENTRKNDSRR